MSIESTSYNSEFYAALADRVSASARITVPLIMDLLSPQSVIDIGCGQGDWLHAFQLHGVADILGIDGDYVKREELRIPPENFRAWDLACPLSLERYFDLALSLEVGEHLPCHRAETFVRSLVALAPAVVFSAAVPGQGGVHHVNEQWPWYWKKLFARHGYVQLDPFRRSLWQNPNVEVYYQHNIFLYVDPSTHRDLIDRVGVPDTYNELTLVRTTLLQELTGPGPVIRLCRRIGARLGRLLGWSRLRRAGEVPH